MKRTLASIMLAGATLLAAGTAAARDVAWSVTVGSHGGGAVSIGLPGMVAAPVYAPPVMVVPPPVVHVPRIVHAPAVVHVPRTYYAPPRHVVYPVAVPYHGPHWHAVAPYRHKGKGKGHWKHRGYYYD